jgi:hypothetical protein
VCFFFPWTVGAAQEACLLTKHSSEQTGMNLEICLCVCKTQCVCKACVFSACMASESRLNERITHRRPQGGSVKICVVRGGMGVGARDVCVCVCVCVFVFVYVCAVLHIKKTCTVRHLLDVKDGRICGIRWVLRVCRGGRSLGYKGVKVNMGKGDCSID